MIHIDTADFCRPHVTARSYEERFFPIPANLVIVTKAGTRRGEDGSWIPAFSRDELIAAVHDNLRNPDLDVLEVVNLRSMLDIHGPAGGGAGGAAYGTGRASAKGFDPSYRAE